MTTPGNYITPQSASAPISTNLRKDEFAALQTVDQNATAEQRVIATGNSVPIVFGVYANNEGGVWVTPPAARYGLQIDLNTGYSFSFGLVLSDGYVPPIAVADIYKGVSQLTTLVGYGATTTYGGLATSGFDYTLTFTTAAIAGTPDTPGYYETKSETDSGIDESRIFSYLRSNCKSVNVSLSFEWKDGYFSAWQSSLASGSLGLGADERRFTDVASVSYSAISPFSSGSSFTASFHQDSRPGISYHRTVYSVSYTYDVWVPTVPGTPGVPPVTSTLPLFPGKGGNFEGMTTLAVKGRYALEAEERDAKQQIRCFVRNGMHVQKLLGGTGSSDSFPDLARHLLVSAGKVPAALIDTASFIAAERFTARQQMRFNGVLANSVNLRDYLSRVAPLFLLRFVKANGKFALKPALPIDGDYSFQLGAITPVLSFDDSSIVAGSFAKYYVDARQRRPFCALMTWRAQSSASFGVPNTTEVRYTGTAADGPFEQYDMEEFCTTERHASTIGRFLIASRKHTTHTVSFQTTASVGSLAPADVIRVTWDYASSAAASSTSTYLYQVDAVTEGADGVFRVEATHFPVTASGASQVAIDTVSGI